MIIIAVLIGCLKRNNSKAATSSSNDIEMYWDDLAKRDAKSKQ